MSKELSKEETKPLVGSYFTDIYPHGDSQQTVTFLQEIVELMYAHIEKINNRQEKVESSLNLRIFT